MATIAPTRRKIIANLNKMNVKELELRLDILKDEVKFYKTFLRPSATGHIHTTINFISNRISDLEKQQALRTYPFKMHD